MPIAQLWNKARVSSPYILELVESTCVSDKYKTVMRMTRYAQSKEQVYWQGSTDQTGAPDRSGPARAQSKTMCVLFGPKWSGQGCKPA
jgi:hypothetical protein